MSKLKAIVIGAGQRGNAYAAYALDHPEAIQFVGVAEPHERRRNDFAEKYGIDETDCLHTWEDIFTRDKWADAVFICNQDRQHYGPTMAAIAKGYDILLEKPASPEPKECLEMAEAAEKAGVKVVVCHVMRYTPFATRIKEIIDSGEIGEIMSIVHNENVGDIHQSHSFVRGNWSVTKESAPMILAKSCHDLDMLQWLLGTKCKSLSSYGALSFFYAGNRPAAAPPRCIDGCPADCPYDSRKLYLDNSKASNWFRSVAAGYDYPSDEDVEAALRTGPYGRCVFQCGNDVVDHQVVSMLFENDVTVLFSMSGFTPDTSRSIKIMGTKGQIKAHTSDKNIKVYNFVTRTEREIDISSTGGHGGGDTGIIASFINYLQGNADPNISGMRISAENHMLAFAAEDSRLKGGALATFGEDSSYSLL